ncbi:ribonuclease HII [Campylobacter sp. 19-13652]|uniref:ribonuclease HII n=1 Tax=Campylobacter sp. 19-13652 TaxID=2840180 RepID=UPI001C77E2D0|nr:ribonuclease HII [Campylobacter sp. 19-13652]BCX80224.1 ribonuclease HII [Campylobacter sp. 19-13652]
MQELDLNICGIDEAGRGALAGPLVVAGCVLLDDIEWIDDSKKLSAKKREALENQIKAHSKYLIIYFSNQDIDSFGISRCMRLALSAFKSYFRDYDLVFDGKADYASGIRTIIQADGKIKQVAAASILAKVTRDRLMILYDKIYPQYDYAKHKGYGTKEHISLIKQHGYGELGRKSFVIKCEDLGLFS